MGDRPINQGPLNMGYVMNAGGRLGRRTGPAAHGCGSASSATCSPATASSPAGGHRIDETPDGDGHRVAHCDVWLRRDGDPDDTVMAGTATVLLDEGNRH